MGKWFRENCAPWSRPVAALFMFSDVTAAMPIAPMNNDSGISPILCAVDAAAADAAASTVAADAASTVAADAAFMAAALGLPRRRRARRGLSRRGSSWRGLSWRRLSRRRLSGWPCGRRRRTWRLGARLWLAGRRSNCGRRRRRFPDGRGRRRLCYVAGASSGLMLVLQRRFTAFGFLGHLSVTTPFAAFGVKSKPLLRVRAERAAINPTLMNICTNCAARSILVPTAVRASRPFWKNGRRNFEQFADARSRREVQFPRRQRARRTATTCPLRQGGARDAAT